MNAKELKSKLTTEHIITLMYDFGVEPIMGRNDNELMFRTICHGGDSHKLYFYKDSHNFHCYTNCGSMDILQIVQNVLGCELPQAISYVAKRFGLGNEFQVGFAQQDCDNDDWSIINRYKSKTTQTEQIKEIVPLDESYLRHYYDIYHMSFIRDGIDIGVMWKYEIMFDIANDRIIIPHRDDEGRLIAIRCRNLDQELVDTGRKYMPVIVKNKPLSAPTSQYFYGLYFNKDYIKRIRKVILVESEKAVMQVETMFPNQNFTLALSSSSISNYQINMLKELGVEEVIVALDKEYDVVGSEDEYIYRNRVQKTILNRLKQNGFSVSVMWDIGNLLKRKQSPTDAGKDVFLTLYNNRFNYEILGEQI